MEIPLLKAVLIIFSLAIGVIFICHRFKIPTIVGFLLTGILAGPKGLQLVQETHQVEILAEIGIILLLFTIGIEFSFDRLSQIKKPALIGGTLQVVLTCLIVFLMTIALGRPLGEAIFAGFLISLSSTAIVLKLIQERAEVDSPHGRASLGILIFQDIIIVPMMLITPMLAGAGDNIYQSLAILLLKGLGIVLLVVVSTKWIVPQLLFLIAQTRNRELFLLSIVVMCFAIALLTSSAGLSLALGAFLAGLIISESDYSHYALGSILPFRDIFTSFFFVSIGMLFDVRFLFEQPALILFVVLIVIGLKFAAAGIAASSIGFPIRSAVLVGLSLSQVGEFSFILSKSGVQYGLLNNHTYNLFLSVSILTMAMTPFIISIAPRISNLILSIPLFKHKSSGLNTKEELPDTSVKDHLIIVGFGINGKNVARAAYSADIPYLILEMNADIVKHEKKNGEPIFFGDATQEALLVHAKIKEARVMVIAISDPAATRGIIEIAKRLNKNVYIIVRTRYIDELEPLYLLGANEVIPEEFETSVEIFTRVLNKYLIPKDEIEQFISEVRSDSYEMFRTLSKKSLTLVDLKVHAPDIEICSIRVEDNSYACGKTLADIELRKKYGVTALAIRSNSEVSSNPHGETKLKENDVVFIVGHKNKISQVSHLFIKIHESAQ